MEPSLKQVYLVAEEAEEILYKLQHDYPNDRIHITQENLFYSAVNKAKQYAVYKGEGSVEEHAARQMLAFAEMHALSNGNKRMGLWACYVVLVNNGFSFRRNKWFFKRLAPVLEKMIKYKKYSFPFLVFTISLCIKEHLAPSIRDFEEKSQALNRRRLARKKKKRERKKRG